MYLDQLQFDPYPVQEEALLAWYTHKEGVLVCAPTGTGKTITGLAYAEEFPRTLWLAHRDELAGKLALASVTPLIVRHGGGGAFWRLMSAMPIHLMSRLASANLLRYKPPIDWNASSLAPCPTGFPARLPGLRVPANA